MGINFLLPIIAGIVMTVMIGTQVAPSYIEKIKIAKVENRTISNQEVIKVAIDKYIELTGENPKTLEDLENQGMLKQHHKDNFFGGTYSFVIDDVIGTLTIYTQINDDNASRYFKNSFKSKITPTCVEKIGDKCKDNLFETFFLLTNFKKKVIEVGSIEHIEKEFTKEKIGDKEYYKENPPQNGDKDYAIVAENIVEEYTYDEINDKWVSNGERIVGGIGSETGVFISDLDIPYHTWDETEKELVPVTYKQEKVHCKDTTLSDIEVFVVNQNSGLGEIVWVAPGVSAIQTKIFGNDRQNATNIIGNGTNDLKYIPNNICTSNATNMMDMFDKATNFNQKLNRWDTSRVVDMKYMFYGAKNFNQALNFDTSKVMDMEKMFYGAKNFNQELNLDTSRVTNMRYMFFGAKEFNQPLSFNASKVTDMSGMFYDVTIFNQPLNFDTSSVANMKEMFRDATIFNQPLNFDTSSVADMSNMFSGAKKFNQNLSSWCVIQLSQPTNFSYGSPLQTEFQPQWGKPCS